MDHYSQVKFLHNLSSKLIQSDALQILKIQHQSFPIYHYCHHLPSFTDIISFLLYFWLIKIFNALYFSTKYIFINLRMLKTFYEYWVLQSLR
jgi:hypothetical protein